MSIGNKSIHETTLPLLALRGLVVFPEMTLHFDAGRKKSIEALQGAMDFDQTIFLVNQKDRTEEEPKPEQLYGIGVVAKIRQIMADRKLLQEVGYNASKSIVHSWESIMEKVQQRYVYLIQRKICESERKHHRISWPERIWLNPVPEPYYE